MNIATGFGEGLAHLVGITYGKNTGVIIHVEGFLSPEQFRAVVYALAEIASGRGKHADIFRKDQELTIKCQPAKQEPPGDASAPGNGIPLDEIADQALFGKRPNPNG